MPLPKVHPLTKTFVDLRRCAARLEQYVSYEISHDDDNYDLYLKLEELVKESLDMIPEQYR